MNTVLSGFVMNGQNQNCSTGTSLGEYSQRYTCVMISGESKGLSLCRRCSYTGSLDQSNDVYSVTDFFLRRAFIASSNVSYGGLQNRKTSYVDDLICKTWVSFCIYQLVHISCSQVKQKTCPSFKLYYLVTEIRSLYRCSQSNVLLYITDKKES